MQIYTAKYREDNFRKELDELLKKHGAELRITDDGKQYGMQSGVVEVTMPTIDDEENSCTYEYAEFNI